MAACVSSYNAVGTVDVYSMFYSSSSLDNDWVCFKSATLLPHTEAATGGVL